VEEDIVLDVILNVKLVKLMILIFVQVAHQDLSYTKDIVLMNAQMELENTMEDVLLVPLQIAHPVRLMKMMDLNNVINVFIQEFYSKEFATMNVLLDTI
jgi:hypothetical protein